MAEDQQELSDAEVEERFAEAERAFAESGPAEEGYYSNTGDATTDEEENVLVVEQQKKEQAERYQQILIALGFTRYNNKENGIACKLKVGSLLMGRTFTAEHPIGTMWVQCLSDCEYGKKKDFLKRDDKRKEIPQVALSQKYPVACHRVAAGVVGI